MTSGPSSTNEQGDLSSTLLEFDIFGCNSTTPVPTITHSINTSAPITTNQLSNHSSSFLKSDDRISASFSMSFSSNIGSDSTIPVPEDNHSADTAPIPTARHDSLPSNPSASLHFNSYEINRLLLVSTRLHFQWAHLPRPTGHQRLRSPQRSINHH